MHSPPEELVVLVDEQDQELGVKSKSLVHGKETPLHRGFSVFLFNEKGDVLVQQRSKSKKTWGGIWSNSCCGHPMPGESYESAVKRRVVYELGLEVDNLTKVSDYRYQFSRNGVMENEICPVFYGEVRGEVESNDEEVENWAWMRWGDWLAELEKDARGAEGKWSEWCKEEAELMSVYLEKHSSTSK